MRGLWREMIYISKSIRDFWFVWCTSDNESGRISGQCVKPAGYIYYNGISSGPRFHGGKHAFDICEALIADFYLSIPTTSYHIFRYPPMPDPPTGAQLPRS